ncbi:MAG TPA: tetratricopeptide repeat protein [Thermoanaerobaculia bacterium]|nr:tetratricopeptide repeat protein [Thermoanaerobaculia bacterium]
MIGAAAAFSATAQETEAPIDTQLVEALQSFQELMAAGDLDGAIARLEPLVQRPDAPPTARAILGGLYVEAGRTEEGWELLRPLAQAPDADPAVLFNAGRAALALGDADQGVGFLERAVRGAPLSPAARELGLMRGREGRYPEAYVLLLPWVTQHPEDQVAVLAAAAAAVQLERISEAEELLAVLPQEESGVRLLWGRLLLTKGEPWGAIQMLSPLLAGAPEMVAIDARRTLAEAHLQVGQSADAIAALEGYVGNDPMLAIRLSQAQYQAGSVDDALVTLKPFAEHVLGNEQERQRVPTRLLASLTREYGRLLVAAGRAGDAVAYLEIATAAEPEDKAAWQAFGQALAASGRREQAQQALARFRELDVEGEPGLNQRQQDLADPTGRALREARELLAEDEGERALELLRREIRLQPGDPRPSILEARALLDLERADEGLAAGQRALQIAPDHPDAHYIVGAVLMSLRRFEEAERSLRQTLELAPEHTAALNDLAVLLMQAGRRDEAQPLLERVLQINPNDPVAKANLERLVHG